MSDEQKPIPRDDLSQRSKGQAKAEQSRVKHNRNASPGLKLPDIQAEQAHEDRITQAITKRPNTRQNQYKHQDAIKEIIVDRRRQGATYGEIGEIAGLPKAPTILLWRQADPQFAEACQRAYDDWMREFVEQMVRRAAQIDDARGLTDEPIEISERAIKGKKVSAAALQRHSDVLISHAAARSRAKRAVVSAALAIAERRLPDEWGRDRDQGREVIVIEAPGGWLLEGATAGLDDEDGQGTAAAQAAKRWREIKDVTP